MRYVAHVRYQSACAAAAPAEAQRPGQRASRRAAWVRGRNRMEQGAMGPSTLQPASDVRPHPVRCCYAMVSHGRATPPVA